MGKVVVAPRMKKVSVKLDKSGKVISETVREVSSAGLGTKPKTDSEIVVNQKR